jgi:hypothetical protein
MIQTHQIMLWTFPNMVLNTNYEICVYILILKFCILYISPRVVGKTEVKRKTLQYDEAPCALNIR